MNVNGKESFKFKADNINVNFPTQYFLGSISNGFSATEKRDASWNWNVYDFSVDYSYIDKCDILNNHKHLMTKKNIKQCLALLNSVSCIIKFYYLFRTQSEKNVCF